MTRATTSRLIAVVALLACSACGTQTNGVGSARMMSPQPVQYTGLQWDEATAALTSAHVTNNNLIMMR